MAGEMEGAELNLGVMGIMFSLGGLCYMIPIGLGGESLRGPACKDASELFACRRNIWAPESLPRVQLVPAHAHLQFMHWSSTSQGDGGESLSADRSFG